MEADPKVHHSLPPHLGVHLGHAVTFPKDIFLSKQEIFVDLKKHSSGKKMIHSQNSIHKQ